MRMPRIGSGEEPQSMSAMSDVVFLLLIFFIVTMSGYVEMTLLETNLPVSGGQSSGAPDLQNSLKIEVTADQRYGAESRNSEPAPAPLFASDARRGVSAAMRAGVQASCACDSAGRSGET